ncbi:uncharacterized [Tachysurus ichikawai]
MLAASPAPSPWRLHEQHVMQPLISFREQRCFGTRVEDGPKKKEEEKNNYKVTFLLDLRQERRRISVF